MGSGYISCRRETCGVVANQIFAPSGQEGYVQTRARQVNCGNSWSYKDKPGFSRSSRLIPTHRFQARRKCQKQCGSRGLECWALALQIFQSSCMHDIRTCAEASSTHVRTKIPQSHRISAYRVEKGVHQTSMRSRSDVLDQSTRSQSTQQQSSSQHPHLPFCPS